MGYRVMRYESLDGVYSEQALCEFTSHYEAAQFCHQVDKDFGDARDFHEQFMEMGYDWESGKWVVGDNYVEFAVAYYQGASQ